MEPSAQPEITAHMRYALAHMLTEYALRPEAYCPPDELMRSQHWATFTEPGIATYVNGHWYFQSLSHHRPRLMPGPGLEVGAQCPQGGQ